MFNRRLAFCAALLVAALAPARAGTIFNNIGPGFPGDSSTGYGDLQSFFGTPFIATGSGSLFQIIDDVYDESGPVTMTAGLYADSGGLPGALLESWNVNVPVTDTVTALTSVLHPTLTAGNQYWFVFGPNAAGLQWSGNDEGVKGDPWDGPTLTGITGGGTDPQLGLELTSSTPEPATSTLLAGAFAILLGLRLVWGRLSVCGRF